VGVPRLTEARTIEPESPTVENHLTRPTQVANGLENATFVDQNAFDQLDPTLSNRVCCPVVN